MKIETCQKWLETKLSEQIQNVYINKQYDNSYCIELEYWSNLGENVIISIVVDRLTRENVRKELDTYYENFDAEEHADELFNYRGTRGIPTSLRALLNDADEQEETLKEICEALA